MKSFWKPAVAAGFVAIAGISVQAMLAPNVPAWGFYETLGFTVAIVILAVAGIRVLHDRLSHQHDSRAD